MFKKAVENDLAKALQFAIKYVGKIYRGRAYGDIFDMLPGEALNNCVMGFINAQGKFITQTEAAAEQGAFGLPTPANTGHPFDDGDVQYDVLVSGHQSFDKTREGYIPKMGFGKEGGNTNKSWKRKYAPRGQKKVETEKRIGAMRQVAENHGYKYQGIKQYNLTSTAGKRAKIYHSHIYHRDGHNLELPTGDSRKGGGNKWWHFKPHAESAFTQTYGGHGNDAADLATHLTKEHGTPIAKSGIWLFKKSLGWGNEEFSRDWSKKQFAPALLHRPTGKVISHPKAATHWDSRLWEQLPKEHQSVEHAEPNGAVETGWINKEGKFHTRAEAAKIVNQTHPLGGKHPRAYLESTGYHADPKAKSWSLVCKSRIWSNKQFAPALKHKTTGKVYTHDDAWTHYSDPLIDQVESDGHDLRDVEAGWVNRAGKWHTREEAALKVGGIHLGGHKSSPASYPYLETNAYRDDPKAKSWSLIRKAFEDFKLKGQIAAKHYRSFGVKYRGHVFESLPGEGNHYDIISRRISHTMPVRDALKLPHKYSHTNNPRDIIHGYVTHEGKFHSRQTARSHLRNVGASDPETELDFLHEKIRNSKTTKSENEPFGPNNHPFGGEIWKEKRFAPALRHKKTGKVYTHPKAYTHFSPPLLDQVEADGHDLKHGNIESGWVNREGKWHSREEAARAAGGHAGTMNNWGSISKPKTYLESLEYHKDKTAKSNKLAYRTKYQGIPIAIENRRGSWRKWKQDGTHSKTKMLVPYGYFPRSKSTDDMEVDVFLGPDKGAKRAYVVTNMHGKHYNKIKDQKVMLGFNSPAEAKTMFMAHYDSHKHFGSMRTVPVEKLKTKLAQTKRNRTKLIQ